MALKAWSFLVSRNRHLDYRTIVAPDFLCEIKCTTLLARATEGEMTPPGQAFFREVIGTKAGDLAIVYQVIKASSKCLDPEVDERYLKDSFGRDIFLIEGLLFQGIIPELFDIKQQHLEHVNSSVMEAYRLFWDASEPPAVIPSHFHYLAEELPGPNLTLLKVPQFAIRVEPVAVPMKVPTPDRDLDEATQRFEESGFDDYRRSTNWLNPRLLIAYSILALSVLTILLSIRYFSFRIPKETCEIEFLPPITVAVDTDVIKAIQLWQSKYNKNILDPSETILIVVSGNLHIHKRLPRATRATIIKSIGDAEQLARMGTKSGSIHGSDYSLRLTDYPLSLILNQSTLKESIYLAKGANIILKRYDSPDCVR